MDGNQETSSLYGSHIINVNDKRSVKRPVVIFSETAQYLADILFKELYISFIFLCVSVFYLIFLLRNHLLLITLRANSTTLRA